MSDPYISALQEQAALVPEEIRQAIGHTLRTASVKGFQDFNELLLFIIGHGLAGNFTPEQVKALTPLLELLFASVSAQQMREDAWRMQRIEGKPDPVGEFLDAAAKGAKKIRPTIEMSDDGDNGFTLTTTTPQGKEVVIARQGYRGPSIFGHPESE